MSVLRLADLDVAGQRVLIRQDLNVPVEDGRGGRSVTHELRAEPGEILSARDVLGQEELDVIAVLGDEPPHIFLVLRRERRF